MAKRSRKSSVLHIGIILNDWIVSDWLYNFLQDLKHTPNIKLTIFSFPPSLLVRGQSTNRVSRLYKFYYDTEKNRFKAGDIYPDLIDLSLKDFTVNEMPPPGELEKISKHKIGLFIFLADSARNRREYLEYLSEHGKYGCWELRFGDNYDLAFESAGEWEMLHGKAQTPVWLFVCHAYERALLLKNEIATNSSSPFLQAKVTVGTGYNLIYFAIKRLILLYPTVEEYRQGLLWSPDCLSKSSLHLIGHSLTFRFMFRNLWRVLSDRIRKNRGLEQWNVGVSQSNLALSEYRLSLKDPKWFPLDNMRFIADPFPIKRGALTYVFVEEFPYPLDRGRISYFSYNDLRKFSELIPIIERGYHLSFPFVLENHGALYMLPEQSVTNSVVLYECEEFPGKWSEKAVLLNNFPGIDNVLFFSQGLWWLFTTYGKFGGDTNNLHLFFAESIYGPYREHPKNPIVLGVNGSRMAGKVFRENGKLIRPGQNCLNDYGGSIVFHEIVTLSEDDYQERTLFEKGPDSNWAFNRGFHTINFFDEDSKTAFDAARFI